MTKYNVIYGNAHQTVHSHIQDGNRNIRATQIGVVSRGLGCAGFNNPGIFGSVKKIYPWIKKVIEKEMKPKDFCLLKPSKRLGKSF